MDSSSRRQRIAVGDPATKWISERRGRFRFANVVATPTLVDHPHDAGQLEANRWDFG